MGISDFPSNIGPAFGVTPYTGAYPRGIGWALSSCSHRLSWRVVSFYTVSGTGAFIHLLPSTQRPSRIE